MELGVENAQIPFKSSAKAEIEPSISESFSFDLESISEPGKIRYGTKKGRECYQKSTDGNVPIVPIQLALHQSVHLLRNHSNSHGSESGMPLYPVRRVTETSEPKVNTKQR